MCSTWDDPLESSNHADTQTQYFSRLDARTIAGVWMMRRLRKLQALDRQSRQLLLQAVRLLAVTRLAILLRSFKGLVAGMEVHGEVFESDQLSSSSLSVARRVGWAVQTAARFLPWESSCLVQVLTAQRMLQRLGIAGVLYLGADKQPGDGEIVSFAAHAWLKCHKEFITGESGQEQYVVVSCFSWC